MGRQSSLKGFTESDENLFQHLHVSDYQHLKPVAAFNKSRMGKSSELNRDLASSKFSAEFGSIELKNYM